MVCSAEAPGLLFPTHRRAHLPLRSFPRKLGHPKCITGQLQGVSGQYPVHAVLLSSHRHRLSHAEIGNQLRNKEPGYRPQQAI